MISVNYVRPSIATLDVGNVSPCRNKDASWAFRMRNCFIAEVFGVDDKRGSVSSIMKLQCVHYCPQCADNRKELCDNGYDVQVAAIDSVIRNGNLPTESVAIVESVLIDNRANVGDLRLACSRLHCLICQCLGIGFGDMKYFGWYITGNAIDKDTMAMLDCLIPKYEDGDIRRSGNFFYKIPWDCQAEKEKWVFRGKTWEQMTDAERKECLRCAKVGSCIDVNAMQKTMQANESTQSAFPETAQNSVTQNAETDGTVEDLIKQAFPVDQRP